MPSRLRKAEKERELGQERYVALLRAGIRAAMEAGFGRLNDLTIIQISQVSTSFLFCIDYILL
jgi:hypothetical protein